MKLSDVEQLRDSYANLQSTPISINMQILFCVCVGIFEANAK